MPKTLSSRIEEIIQSVDDEFGDKFVHFKPIALRMNALERDESEAAKVAGVYVFVHDDLGCIKVGKSQSNALKRALQHCGSDNTSSKDKAIQMAALRRCDKTYLLIFALQNPESMHWVVALEHFLEKRLQPTIRSVRNG